MNGRITAYIHMDAVADNFKNMRANLKENTKMIAVVKTDAYGHGAAEVAGLAETYDYIWGFAAATVDEAKELRTEGIKKPILILGYTFEEDYEWMVVNQVRPAAFTVEMADAFARAAQKCRLVAPVHIAVDTGMSRIGVSCREQGLEIVKKIAALDSVSIEGVFTHFSKADEYDKSFTREQMDRFTNFCNAMEKMGITGFMRHCSNSAGIMELPEANMDMVRAGISIYGIAPSEEVSQEQVALRPVMELKSHIVYIKEIEAGTAVSYGGTYVAPAARRIATIPVGYGDGYPRSLSNKGYVLIHGKKAPILGRICMDQFMVDVTEIEANLLDEVTLLGKDAYDEITLEELGRLSGRFPYEFLCDIGKRVPRVYVGLQ